MNEDKLDELRRAHERLLRKPVVLPVLNNDGSATQMVGVKQVRSPLSADDAVLALEDLVIYFGDDPGRIPDDERKVLLMAMRQAWVNIRHQFLKGDS